ncbi:MAG: cation-efflux pump, partial [Lachnospiraceae bacterium]|nr:cation-efflux pump [Lachnospiraceae bacterium]
EIGVDGEMSLHAAHQIAEETHDMIEHAFPQIKHVMIQVNPV